jgi:uracil-DNA glycosylase family 4
MGFWNIGKHVRRADTIDGVSIKTIHVQQCAVCPLNHQHGLKHPHMPAYGVKRPEVYLLGEAPGAVEDQKGRAFVGPAGQLLHTHIPAGWEDKLRYNNCVRTRPPNNETPTDMIIEACRPSVESDIEASKPKAIFGFGNIPLKWAFNQTGISNWAGRRVPVRIGNHTCWYFPMFHPSHILRSRDERKHKESDLEFTFARHLRDAFKQIAGLPKPTIHTTEDALQDVEFVTGKDEGDLQRVLDFIRVASNKTIVGFDYETNALRPYGDGAKILTVGLSHDGGTLAFPLHHKDAGWSANEYRLVDTTFKNFLHNAKCRKVVHSLGFEMEWSAHFYGPECLRSSKWGDTQSQAFILDERRGCLSLNFLCQQYFGLDLKAIENTDVTNLENTDVETVLRYNGLDAKYHRLLYRVQLGRLAAEGLQEVYLDQLSRIPTVTLTQLEGVPVDQERVEYFREQLQRRCEKILAKIHTLPVVQRFNQTGKLYQPGSSQQTRAILKNALKLDVEKADEKVLKNIDHPFAKLTLKYRQAHKLLSTYIEPLVEGNGLVHADGMLHPIYHCSSTRTNRTSTDEPNIQNQPKRKNVEVRSVVCHPERKIVSFDYGQIQARNIAMESEDEKLIQYMWDRHDIHGDWMKRLMKIDPDWGGDDRKDPDGLKKLRHRSKNELVFPSFFGAQPRSVARSLGIEEHLIEKVQSDFFQMFPGVHDWHKRLHHFYHKHGYVTGLSGFRRRAPISVNQLINSPIQADEAIIVINAMTRLSIAGYQAAMEIHDDLTFIWKPDDIERYAPAVIGHMLSVPYKWANVVPIVVEMSVGDDWSNGHTIGAFSSDTWKGKLEPSQLQELTGSWDDGTGWIRDDE